MLTEILKTVEDQYSEWWAGKNKNALLVCSWYDHKAFNKKVKKYEKDWMLGRYDWVLSWALEKALREENMKYIHEALDIIELQLECENFAGAGFPSYFTNLGAGCLSAVITGYSHFYNNTTWFELKEPMEWEHILSENLSNRTAYAELATQAVKAVGARLKDKAVVSMLDLGGVVDILASLRRSDTLLFDTVDYPDEFRRSTESIQKIWKSYHDEIQKILDPVNEGYYTSWMSVLSDKPYYPSQCDFSAMISPEMFEEFVLPSLSREMSWYDKGVYHLDGPGELPHLDLLLGIKNLHAVQWVPMPFQPRHDEMHYGLYKKLIENGKKIILNGFEAEYSLVKKLFSHLPKEAFCLTLNCKNREDADKIATLA